MCGIDGFLSRLRGEDNGLRDQFSLFILLAVFNGESSPAMVTLQYILINSVCNLEMTVGEKEIRIKQRAKGESIFSSQRRSQLCQPFLLTGAETCHF